MLAVEPSGRRLLAFVGLYALAVALHATWDGVGGSVTYAVVGAISIGLLMIALRQAQRLDSRRLVPVTAA